MPVFRRLAPGHPGETEVYREKFRQATVLVCLYRIAGTGAAGLGLMGNATARVDTDMLLVLLLLGYVLYSVALIHSLVAPTRLWPLHATFGRGSRGLLDSAIFPFIDVAIAVVINVLFAATLPPGTAYQQYTDLFAVAMIGTVVLWSGRYGGRVGLALLLVAAGTEVLKAPVNSVPSRSVDGWVVATRVTWSACGLLVAVLTVRVLLQFADRDERLNEDQQILHRASRTHDIAKQALSSVHRILSSQLPAEDSVRRAGVITAWAVNEMSEPPTRSATEATPYLEELVEEAFRGTRLLCPTIALQAVDAVHEPVQIAHRTAWATLLRNLVLNGAQHSGGTQVTVRWKRDGDALVVTVKDDGRGLTEPANRGTGLAIARSAALELGAGISSRSSGGCRWEIRMPNAFVVDASTAEVKS